MRTFGAKKAGSRDNNRAGYAAARCCWYTAPRSVQLKSALRHSVSAAPRTKIFLHFFTIIAGDFPFMNNNN